MATKGVFTSIQGFTSIEHMMCSRPNLDLMKGLRPWKEGSQPNLASKNSSRPNDGFTLVNSCRFMQIRVYFMGNQVLLMDKKKMDEILTNWKIWSVHD